MTSYAGYPSYFVTIELFGPEYASRFGTWENLRSHLFIRVNNVVMFPAFCGKVWHGTS